MTRIGSLFSGGGGLDLAVQDVFGGELIWKSEIDSAASKVLAHRFPWAPNLGDITEINWENIEAPDVMCGGWPCQPFSIAGKKKGIHDKRALWPYINRAICALRPSVIVLENVSRVLSAGEFDRVAADLAQARYEFAWTCVRASDIGAPHSRERAFIVAYTEGEGLERPLSGWDAQEITGYASDSGFPEQPKLLPTPAAADGSRGPDYARANRSRSGTDDLVTVCARTSRDNNWGNFEDAITRWERLTRPAPSPYEENRNGNPRLNAAFSEWMMGWPNGWVTDPKIGLLRRDQLSIIGNGVVPQQAVLAINFLLDHIAKAVSASTNTIATTRGISA